MIPTADRVVEDGHGNIIERTVDHGDGTGVRTDYRTDPPTVTELTGLPVPEPPAPAGPTVEQVQAARDLLGAATTVSQTKTRALALDDLRAAQIAALTPET